MLTHPTGYLRVKFFCKNLLISYQHIYLGHSLKNGVWAYIIVRGCTGATPNRDETHRFYALTGLINFDQWGRQRGQVIHGEFPNPTKLSLGSVLIAAILILDFALLSSSLGFILQAANRSCGSPAPIDMATMTSALQSPFMAAILQA